jgi:hypothetical protein
MDGVWQTASGTFKAPSESRGFCFCSLVPITSKTAKPTAAGLLWRKNATLAKNAKMGHPGMICRPYGTRFYFFGATQDLRPGLLSAAPPGLYRDSHSAPRTGNRSRFFFHVSWRAGTPFPAEVILAEAAPVFAVFEGRGFRLPGRLSFWQAHSLVSSRSVVSHPSKIAKGGAASVVVVQGWTRYLPIPSTIATRRSGDLKPSAVPPGLGSTFLGAYPGLPSWAIIGRPSGAVSRFPFWDSVPLFFSIFLPLTFLSCRI